MEYRLTNRVAECRIAKGINKSQLAFRLKMSRAYVTRLERGDIHPSAVAMLRIADYFGKPVKEIFQLVIVDGSSEPAKPGLQTISRPCSAADRNHKNAGINKIKRKEAKW